MFILFDPREYNMYALLSVKNGRKRGWGESLGGQQRKVQLKAVQSYHLQNMEVFTCPPVIQTLSFMAENQ